MQAPPAFSAIKVQGERAYDLARAGEAVDLAPRPVFIEKLDLLDLPDADHAVFETECGKGTYIRSLARDMGRALGCLGPCRERCGGWRSGLLAKTDMISLEKLEEMRHKAPGDIWPWKGFSAPSRPCWTASRHWP